jgi:ATP-dependent helicase/nuclease subunit B
VQIRFLLGPAGSGKTCRCLGEIRAELARSPGGPPLVLLAPKQATFQLERQLLSLDGAGSRGSSPRREGGDPLAGYTRLQILSFDRLADCILAGFGKAPAGLLGDEGRVMALRALLGRHQSKLKIFHATARLPGFARQLSLLLREFQRQRLSPRRLAGLADQLLAQPGLAGKLHDSALLLDAYEEWLERQHLEDADRLLDLAGAALQQSCRRPMPDARPTGGGGDAPFAPRPSPLFLGGLWLDGFAEMTPQELDLLAAFLPNCERATLAFCLDAEAGENPSWLSGWSVVERTFHQCRERAAALPGCSLVVETLKRDPEHSRFHGQPLLQHLERNWSTPAGIASGPARPATGPPSSSLEHPASSIQHGASSFRLVVCANPEAEAALAAREIRRFVRCGGRFREAAVLVRRLEDYHDVLRRVLTRYDIPFFLDRREPVAHHPLAELTRYALRLAAFGWPHDDWFGALKTGLATEDEAGVDRLENEALARGWQGNAWFQPLKTPGDVVLEKSVNQWLGKVLPAFIEWNRALKSLEGRPTGGQLAAALRQLWSELDVELQLERWAVAEVPGSEFQLAASVHATVWDQMNAWLDNVDLAFAGDALAVIEWLPILEAGLANLSVGVIPPALDQVLIGAIDRSRNPELKLVLLPGWNETVFPALPAAGPLLTETEREMLAGRNVPLGLDRRQQIGRERFYAYIACTRARERLVITCAAHDAEGQALYPSPFFDHVKQITGVAEEKFSGAEPWPESVHICELAAPVLRAQTAPGRTPGLAQLGALPALAPLVLKWRQIQESFAAPGLAADVAERIYGRELLSSVSGLEDFAACPFKFFAARGLRLQERKEFEFDDRDKGRFQHEVLCEFHRRIRKSGRRWRDLGATEARDLVCAIGRERLPDYGGGRFLAGGAARFTGEFLIERLGRLVTTLIDWMPQYGFDPELVEVGFGLDPEGWPGWRLELPGGRALLLRGRIDRVDVCRADPDTALVVVMDYKSSVRNLNPTKLHHGLELQLLSYLGVLQHLAGPEMIFGAPKLSPAGVFYVPLNGGGGRLGATRAEVLDGGDAARRVAYQHSGRFLAEALERFDNRGLSRGDQFKFFRKVNGSLGARANDALPTAEFAALREKIEGHLRDYARRIFAGESDVSPFRIGGETACDRCDFRSVCRFDPWIQPFRELRPQPKPVRETPVKKGKTAGVKP